MGQGEGGGGYARAVPQDAAAGGGAEEVVAEPGDEVGGCGCFAEGGYEVCGDMC